MLQEVFRAISFRPRVLATGGEAERLGPWVPEIDVVAPDLVFEGLAIAWREARGKGDGLL
jgi:pantothenate kinase type III